MFAHWRWWRPGAATVAQARLFTAGDYLTLLLFCLLVTSSFLAIELYAAFAPAAATTRLGQGAQAIIVGSLLEGIWLAGNSIKPIVT